MFIATAIMCRHSQPQATWPIFPLISHNDLQTAISNLASSTSFTFLLLVHLPSSTLIFPHLLLFSSVHLHSLSLIFIYLPLFLIHLHSNSLNFIHTHPSSIIFIYLHKPSFTFAFFHLHLPSSSSISLHSPSSTPIGLYPRSPTFISLLLPSYAYIYHH